MPSSWVVGPAGVPSCVVPAAGASNFLIASVASSFISADCVPACAVLPGSAPLALDSCTAPLALDSCTAPLALVLTLLLALAPGSVPVPFIVLNAFIKLLTHSFPKYPNILGVATPISTILIPAAVKIASISGGGFSINLVTIAVILSLLPIIGFSKGSLFTKSITSLKQLGFIATIVLISSGRGVTVLIPSRMDVIQGCSIDISICKKL